MLSAPVRSLLGVDYEAILRQAEKEADVILWDGGNNDTSFYRPDLSITVLDPHRAGHELGYSPGEVNFRSADVLIINKVDTADPDGIKTVRQNIALHNPKAGSWQKYIEDWQQAYREAPVVKCCTGCRRQYPVSLEITECFRCGSKKIETAKLRRADMRSLAKLGRL